MVTYDDYVNKFNDDLEEEEFDILLSSSDEIIRGFCESFISKFSLKENFDEYDIDIDDATLFQINFIESIGGVAALQGQSDLQLESVSTSGFNYKYKGGNIQLFNGVPLSPVAVIKIKGELRRKIYLQRCVR